MNKQVKFKDGNNNLVSIDIEISTRNEFPELSMSGSMGGSCGQIQDQIVPANSYQVELLEIWHKYHLNGMSSGTPEQDKLLYKIGSAFPVFKDLKNASNYSFACSMLNLFKLLTVISPENGKPFKYGSAWYHCRLPENIEEQINHICNKIIEVENEKASTLLTENDKKDYENEVLALAEHLELETQEEIEDIEGNNPYYSYCGIDYIVTDQDTAYQLAKDYLTDDPYIWQESVQAGQTELGLEEWAGWVIDVDGIGHILNGWDGTDDYITFNDSCYFVCRV